LDLIFLWNKVHQQVYAGLGSLGPHWSAYMSTSKMSIWICMCGNAKMFKWQQPSKMVILQINYVCQINDMKVEGKGINTNYKC
jgi:hypothetical protein